MARVTCRRLEQSRNVRQEQVSALRRSCVSVMFYSGCKRPCGTAVVRAVGIGCHVRALVHGLDWPRLMWHWYCESDLDVAAF